MSSTAAARLCPLCHRPNQCGASAGAEGAKNCWCHRVRVPPELLALVPAAERDKACVCPECVEAFARATPPAAR